ncbi:Crotonobetainyl-CoA:carnitine CoA-transferase CaiB [Catalinimonas alkaloidigena]|uniref:Crotonobetainyl-CoA:carnitine CoA-transferase CaiB n=1 Tax=Catalinimonas alkaloidigena TaxID=1075417 RepID=A0A1G9LZU6_9BACT|nr:CaiB/BaiF CoA-transferase family protein [Catalinimonas alkaloidigena]SDL67414.1 Crotonobetainyl-CoA:carnitine CoA-transferase CaiB [Catalinimonas alkaloidigena]
MPLLEDLLVVDFSQFLSGPSASLRLSDLGARVIKIEKAGSGDICRQLYVSDVRIEGESTIFHAINRNKESYTADLKNPADLARIQQLLQQADVMLHNFRPGVIERLGLDYPTVKALNPQLVYGEISGYGETGPWRDKPGQDLLLQAISGLTWLSHDQTAPPTPMGVAVADILAGTHLAQGVLAALYQRAISNEGALVQVSMLESALDFQFEVFTCFLNDGHQLPERSAVHNAQAYVAAPYGIYPTTDGHLALAMANILTLGELLDCPPLAPFTDPAAWFDRRDEIKQILADHLLTRSTDHWLGILEPADIWCARVLNYEQLRQTEGYRQLGMEMEVRTTQGQRITTTRCPLRIDGERLHSERGAPGLGEHNAHINQEFNLH